MSFTVPRAIEVPSSRPFGGITTHPAETRRWIMSQPLESSNLWHLLTVGLVPIADLDPAFAKLALDPETWRSMVIGDVEIEEEAKERSSRW